MNRRWTSQGKRGLGEREKEEGGRGGREGREEEEEDDDEEGEREGPP